MSEISTADVCEVIAQLAQTNQATRENVVSNLVGFHCVEQQQAESVIRDALMRGEVYEPQDGRLARTSPAR